MTGAAAAQELGGGFCCPNASGLAPSNAGMWCCSPWTCSLLVRTNVRWTAYSRTVVRSKRQVRFIDIHAFSHLRPRPLVCIFTFLRWHLELTLNLVRFVPLSQRLSGSLLCLECAIDVGLTSTDKSPDNWKRNGCFSNLHACFFHVEFTSTGMSMSWLESARRLFPAEKYHRELLLLVFNLL